MNSTVTAEGIAQGESFELFMNSLRDPAFAAPIVSARRFSDALHIDMQTLAKQAGVHRNTLSRTPSSESVQRFLREALRVIRAATRRPTQCRMEQDLRQSDIPTILASSCR